MPLLSRRGGASAKGFGLTNLLSSGPVLVAGTAAPRFGAAAATWVSSLDNAPTNAGWTLAVSSSADDAFFSFTSQFSVYIYGTASTSINVSSNTYVSIVSGSTVYFSLSFTNPALNNILLGAADNSYQRAWYYAQPTVSYARYEGTAATGGTPGSPNIVFEIAYYKAVGSVQYIEIRVGLHARTGGVFGITNGSTSFVNGGTIAANQSYVIATDATGNSPVIYTGYYIA